MKFIPDPWDVISLRIQKMDDVVVQPAAPVATDDVHAVYCPSCGYDLRGSDADRCSECGKIVDRTAGNVSAIPWAHRRRTGRMRSFWRTVGRVTLDRKSIRYELSRVQMDRDAQRFRWWNAACLWCALLMTAFLCVWFIGWDDLLPVSSFGSYNWAANRPRLALYQDTLVPWSAGISVITFLPIYLAGLSIYLASLGRSLYRLPGETSIYRQRAQAVSAYASAPLAMFLPASILVAAGTVYSPAFEYVERELGTDLRTLENIGWVLVFLGGVLAIIALLNSVHRAAQWVTRAYRGGTSRYIVAVLEIMGRTTVGIAMFLGVLPWCAGLWLLRFTSGS